MPHICPATGHVVANPRGVFYPNHGVALFTNCPACGQGWPPTGYLPTLSGEDLHPTSASTVRTRARGSRASSSSRGSRGGYTRRASTKRLNWELREALDRIKDMEPGDSRTIAAWQKLKDALPNSGN